MLEPVAFDLGQALDHLRGEREALGRAVEGQAHRGAKHQRCPVDALDGVLELDCAIFRHSLQDLCCAHALAALGGTLLAVSHQIEVRRVLLDPCREVG